MPKAYGLLASLLATFIVVTSCRKEVEKLVVQQVDKQYSSTAGRRSAVPTSRATGKLSWA